jgi:hypothetical protein
VRKEKEPLAPRLLRTPAKWACGRVQPDAIKPGQDARRRPPSPKEAPSIVRDPHALGYLAVILLAPDATWALLLPLLACGLGMGGCFGSVFAVALGDVQPDQAGSASGTLNAVQQIATAAGAALISAAYLAAASTSTARDASRPAW